jgi:hypothetical protein
LTGHATNNVPSPKKEKISPEVKAILAEWRPCHEAFYQEREKKPFRVNQTMIDHAACLLYLGLTPQTLSAVVQAMLEADKTDWYGKHGLHLGSVVNWVEAHPQVSALKTMTYDEANAFARSLLAVYPAEVLGVDSDRGDTWFTCLKYGPDDEDWLYFRSPDHYAHPSDWEAERLEWVRQSVAKRLTG